MGKTIAILTSVTLLAALSGPGALGAAAKPTLGGERQLLQVSPSSTARSRSSVREIDFQYQGTDYRLVLNPTTVRAKNFKVTVVDEEGIHHPATVEAPQLFQGTLANLTEAQVAARIENDKVTAYIKMPNGEILGIEPDQKSIAPYHTVYSSSDIPSSTATCAVLAPSTTQATPPDTERLETAGVTAAASAGAASVYIADIAFDADYEFYVKNNASLASTVADIESIVNGVNTIYERDVNIRHNISEIIVRQSSFSNPYSSNQAETLLNQFTDYWQDNYTFGANAIERDMAHLMTGRPLTGSTIGLAFVGVICDSPGTAYGLSESRYSSSLSYAQRVALTAHELAHNWDASHCSCNIMCDTIGGCTGILTQFSQATINTIVAFRDNNLSCLDAESIAPPGATDDSFSIESNTSVDLDILNNDTEFSNLPYTLASITQPSHGRASINPDNTIRYHSEELFAGSDSFSYTTINAIGGPFMATVTLTIGAGINYEYYEGSYSTLPNFSSLTPVTTGTTETFSLGVAERNYDFALLFTAILNVPRLATYSFYLKGLYQARLFIDGSQKSLTGGGVGVEYLSIASLTPGPHTIELQYYYNHFFSTSSLLDLKWSSPYISKQAIGLEYLELSNPNLSPIALDDEAYTIENSPVTVQVLTNDYDPEGLSITLLTNSTPSGGTANISGTGLLYTPALNFNGTDQINYSISDNLGATNGATLEILVDTDTDSDSIYNAFDPDDDNDGLSDEDEAIAGTSATNSQSYFMTEIESGPALTFMGVGGRLYQVQYKTNLNALTWSALGTELNGQGLLLRVPTTNTNDAAYYRVGVRLAP